MRYSTVSAYAVALVACIGIQTAHTQINCGDANGDGKRNIADATYGFAYLFDGGPPPVDFQEGDFDRRTLFTIADAKGLIDCIFGCDGMPVIDCANDPLDTPVYPALDTTLKIIYPNTVPANSSTFVLRLHLNQRQWNISAFTFPLEILLDGQPVSIDSVAFPAADQPLEDFFFHSNIYDSGKIVLGAWSFFLNPSGAGRFVEIHLAIPNSPTSLPLDVSWTTLVPKLGPPQDSSLYPMALGELWFNTFLPSLVGSCCSLASDANGDGRVNIADITFRIARVFAGGLPAPCNDADDANGDNTNNIADITYMIARIFSGGPAPVCGSTGI